MTLSHPLRLSACAVALAGGIGAAFILASPAAGSLGRMSSEPQPGLKTVGDAGKGAPSSIDQASIAAPPPTSSDLASFMAVEAKRLGDASEAVPYPATAERLDRAAVLQIAARCAPATPATALTSIAWVESGFAPLMIGVNGRNRRVYRPGAAAQAVQIAKDLIAAGRNIDLGLAQINSRNLSWLGLSVEDAFEPCRNIAAAAQILDRGYAVALKVDHGGRPILQMAYSIYNTGDTERGLENGYAAKVEAVKVGY